MPFSRSALFLVLPVFLLASSARGDFGNWFIANQRLATALDSSEKKISYRFTCQENMSLTAAAVYCLDAAKSPAYRVSLQTDENGKPSGTPLASASYVPRAQSWSTVPMEATALIKEKTYHLVVEHDANLGGFHPVGAINASHYASFLSTDVLNHIHPNDGSPDPKSNTLLFENGKWKELNQEPVYAVYGIGSRSLGNPYDDPGVRPIHGNGNPNHKAAQVLQGQVLHPHCGFKPTGIAIRVKKIGTPPFPLNYQILSHDYRAHRTSPVFPMKVALNPEQVGTHFQWVTIGFPTEVPGIPAYCYYFVFQTDSGKSSPTSPGCEDCYLISDLGHSGGLSNASDMTFEGGGHLSRATSSAQGGDSLSWEDEFGRDANVGVVGPACPPKTSQQFAPLPTPIPLEKEPRFEP